MSQGTRAHRARGGLRGKRERKVNGRGERKGREGEGETNLICHAEPMDRRW